jgi:aldehyde:ferredoxin oxidoreductase
MADKLGGYTGKILRVDLTTKKITTEDTMKYKDFLGGTGLGYKILWDEVKPGTKAADPENRIIFAVGPVTGTSAPTSARVSITTLWPNNANELPATGHMGGHWGPELKYAGYDAIIVQGKADKPVWLYIYNDQVELRDASRLWGNGIFRTTQEILEEMGTDAHVAAIGQAGENLVRISCVMCDRSHSAGGAGYVMGAKNLKAIGVKGTGSVKIAADKKAWQTLVGELLSLMGGNNNACVPTTAQPWAEYTGSTRWNSQKGMYWGAANPPIETGICSADDLNKMGYRTHKGVLDHGMNVGQRHHVRSSGCQSCPIRCHVMTDVPAIQQYGVSRYNGNTCVGNFFSTGFYTNLKSDTEARIEISQLGTALADDYGLWNDYSGVTQDFVYAYQKGIMKKYLDKADPKEFDSINWKGMETGDPTFVIDIMRRITYKIGELGKAFADGPSFLEKRWPEMAEAHNKEYSMQFWKFGHTKHHSVENGGQVGGLMNIIYNRDPMQHTHTNFLGNGLPLSVQKEIGAELFGTPDAVEAYHDYKPMNKGKAVFVALSLIYLELHNSMTVCNYQLPVWASPRKDRKYRGDIAMDVKIYNAITGEKLTQKDFEKVGLRILTLFRSLTAKFMNEPDMRNKHDLAPDWLFTYPEDKKAFTPGVDKMDKDDWETAKEMLYEQLGWDKKTGMPTEATLKDLGLTDVADELKKLKLLPA